MINLDGSVIDIEEEEEEVVEGLHDVEDLTCTSAVMQSSESPMTFYDEDEITTTGEEGGAESPHRSTATASQTKKKKRRYYAMGVALVLLFAGCGYIAAHRKLGEDDPSSSLSSDGIIAPAEAMGTASTPIGAMPTLPGEVASEVSDGGSVLRSGRTFKIQVADSSRCLGSNSTDANWTRLRSMACDHPELDPVFVYDPFNKFIMSTAKPGFCIDSGAIAPVPTPQRDPRPSFLRLHPCGVESWNQMFDFSADDSVFRSTHFDLCMDGGEDMDNDPRSSSSTTEDDRERFTLQTCTSNRTTQRLEPVPLLRDELSMWQVNHPLLRSGDPFLVRVVGKYNLCMSRSESGPTSKDPSTVRLMDCDPNSADQLFAYNSSSHALRSATNPSLCVDDNGSWHSKAADDKALLRMAMCEARSANQKLVYDDLTMVFRNPLNPHKCLDDGGGYTSSTSSSFHVSTCDLASGNQQFQIILRSTLYSVSPSVLLANQKPFVVESIYKGLCLGDDESGGSAATGGDSTLRLHPCEKPSSASSHVFWYDAANQLFRSVKKPGLCWSAGQTEPFALLRLQSCDPTSAVQKFAHNVDSSSISSQSAANTQGRRCLDDGGGVLAEETQLALSRCDPQSVNQQFRIRAA